MASKEGVRATSQPADVLVWDWIFVGTDLLLEHAGHVHAREAEWLPA